MSAKSHFRPLILGATALACLLGGQVTTVRANDGNDNHPAMAARPQGIMLAGLSVPATDASAQLIFTNAGGASGTATVTLLSAATGTQIATWTSAAIPAHGSLAVSFSAIVSGATPAVSTADAAAPFNLRVTTTFRGTVQELTGASGNLADASSCGRALFAGRGVIGGVAGPGNTARNDAIRLVNTGLTAGHATLTLRDAATGDSLGVWTSPDVAAGASLTTSVTAIAAAATPVVPATATLLTVVETGHNLTVQHLSQLKGSSAVSDISAACWLRGQPAVANGRHGHTEDQDDNDDDDKDKNHHGG